MTVRALPQAKSQLTLDFEPGLTERYPTTMDRLRAAVYASPKPMKTIAADMDMSTSALSRKLSADPDDPRRFSLDDLEKYIAATGDTSVVEYLAVRYLESAEAKQARVVNEAHRLLAELAPMLAAMKGAA